MANHELLIAHGYVHLYHEPLEHSTAEDGILGVDPEWHEYTSATETLYGLRKGEVIEREPMSTWERLTWFGMDEQQAWEEAQ